jgi:Xaa-Pro dipeptidase
VSGIFCIGSGPDRSSQAHSVASNRVLNDGDIIQICQCGKPFAGYGICFDRPCFVGNTPPSLAVNNIIAIAALAQRAALDAIWPGVTAAAVYAAAFDVISRFNLEPFILHGAGCAIGTHDHGCPLLRWNDTTMLQAGMILGVEPGAYLPGVGGACYGDTVLVTADGYKFIIDYEVGREIEYNYLEE